MKKNYFILLIIAICLLPTISRGQAGNLDNTFSGDGKVTTPIGSYSEEARSVAIQSDGKIVVAGHTYNGTRYSIAVVRYTTAGVPDNTFGTGGKVTTDIGLYDDRATSVAIQSDGKIVVAGYSYIGSYFDFAVVRYTTTGALDNTFDTDGIVTTPIGSYNDKGNAMAIQTDGKIVVAGSRDATDNDFAVVRYNTNGSLDNTFGTGGRVNTNVTLEDKAYAMAIQSDGKIVVGGSSFSSFGYPNTFALVRYNTNGTLDNTFDSDGKLTTAIGTYNDYVYSLAIQADGKIVAAGSSDWGTDHDFAMARYNSNGSLDNTFSGDGKLIADYAGHDDFAYGVTVKSDGKIIVAGVFSDVNYINKFGILRYNTGGTLDNTFGSGGAVVTAFGTIGDNAYALALQSDEKIVVAGFAVISGSETDIAVARYIGCTVPSNAGTITGPTSICSSSTNAYSIAAVTGATSYLWTLPGGWSGTSTTTSISATASSTSGNVTVAAQNACGTSTAASLAVAINPPPATPGSISGPTTVCENSVNAYSISAVNGATSYIWTLPGGWSGTSTTTSISATAGATAGNITVRASNVCGNSSNQSLAISVNSAPSTPNITQNGNMLTSSFSVNGYQWNLNGVPIIGATSQSYTFSVSGNYTVTVFDAIGCSATSDPLIITGINEANAFEGIDVFPNPHPGVFTIKAEFSRPQNVDIVVTNILGTELITLTEKNISGSYRRQIEMNEIANGVYFLKIKIGAQTSIKKIVKN
jgi:uncharacterized delta-60 repeat protein